MKIRIKQLEEQLSKATSTTFIPSPGVPTSLPDIEVSTAGLGATYHFHRESGQPQAATRSATHKTRMFGQSHWVHGFKPVSLCTHSSGSNRTEQETEINLVSSHV